MHPILFRIPVPNWDLPGIGPLHEAFAQGSIPLYSYGIMLGLSLVVGWYLTLWLAERDGLPKEAMANCYIVTALAAVAGARILYFVTNPGELHSFWDLLAFRRGGLVAYGGFLGGFVGSWIFLKMKRIPLMPWADVAVPSLASGLFITRIGCYMFGCDFGRRLDDSAPAFLKSLGSFPKWEAGLVDHGEGAPAWIQHLNGGLIGHDATYSLPVHPTQLYESALGLGLLGLLFLQRKNQRFRGQVFMLFAFAYGFSRFLLEIVRDDAERGLYGPSAGAHILVPICLVLFAIAYSVGLANGIQSVTVRRVTQGLSIVPALVAFLALRPASFAYAAPIQLSTSQWVGLLTAIAVAVAYMIFAKAAEMHPADAMKIDLDLFFAEEARLEAKAAKKTETSKEDAAAKHTKSDAEPGAELEENAMPEADAAKEDETSEQDGGASTDKTEASAETATPKDDDETASE